MGGRASLGVLRITTFIVVLIVGFASISAGQDVNSVVKLLWSHPAVSTTKSMNREFHGPFGHEDVTVTCDALAKHDFIEISFDFLTMSSWDGSILPLPDGSLEPVGPDYFRLGIQGGPTLLYHTFSNIALVDPPGFRAAHPTSKAQSYPSQVPGTRLPPWAGSKESNSLGYAYTDARVAAVPFVPMDGTYSIYFIIPHDDPKAVLELNGLHLQDPFDENWGIANLHVRTLTAAQVKRPAADSIGVAFRSCLATSGPDDYAPAFQTLIDGMDDTADWIDKNVKSVAVDKRVQAMIIQLQSNKLDEARAAEASLRQMGSAIEPYLRDARIGADGNGRLEIDTALETLGVTPIADERIRQVILATRVLEVIGTRRALSVRNNLTSAASSARADNPTAAAPTSRPWDMHLGDTTLSLVGVSEYSNDPATAIWWAADGSLIAAPPVEANIRRGPTGNSRTRRIAVAFYASGPSVLNPRVLPSPTMPSGGSSIEQNGLKDGWFLFSFLSAPENQTAEILVRFGNGAPNKSVVYDFDPQTMMTKAIKTDPEFELFSANQSNATHFDLTFKSPGQVNDLDWDVVLVTTTGQKVIHQSQNGQGMMMGKGMVYSYGTSANQIKQIIYDSRPWERFQLQNVSLMPGQKTEPSLGNAPPEPAYRGF